MLASVFGTNANFSWLTSSVRSVFEVYTQQVRCQTEEVKAQPKHVKSNLKMQLFSSSVH